MDLEVRIKSGVVMYYGDVKKVARQDFFVLKNSAVAQWKNVLELYPDVDAAVVTAEDKATLNPNSELAVLARELEQQKNNYKEELKKTKQLIEACFDISKKNVNKGIEDNLNESLKQELRVLSNKFEDMKSGAGTALGKSDIKEVVDLYSNIFDVKKTSYWQSQLVQLRAISSQLDLILERAKEIEKKIESLKLNLVAKAKDNLQRAKEAFQSKFKENTITVAKTNLDGEASLRLKKGTYYIFGLAHIGDNFILWDYQIKVDEKNTYFEITNDNALAISQYEEGMVKVFRELFTE
jgi:hypothetical protein